MNVAHPQVLVLLAGIPVLGLIFALEIVHTRAALEKIGGKWNIEESRSTVLFKWFISNLLFLAFYVFGVLALAGMTWGEEPVEQDKTDTDLVYVLDVSRSMTAQDIKPSRLERGLEIIQGTLEEIPNARAALVIFKGEAITLIPMTEDVASLENAIRYVGPDMMSSPGTNVERAINQAIGTFPGDSNHHQIIVLISDGENLSGNPSGTVARERGIPIITVGTGTLSGSGIPDGQSSLKDSTGLPVLTRLDESALKKLSESSGGYYVNAQEPGVFASILNGINNFEERREHEGFHLVPVNRDSLFAGLAALCLGLYVLARSVRWRKQW